MCNSHGDSQGKSHGDLASKGRHGDTELAHVNPTEKAMLEDMGGAGTINPKTGLKEYHWYHNHNSPIKIPKKITPPSVPKPKIIENLQNEADNVFEAVNTDQDLINLDLSDPVGDVEDYYKNSALEEIIEQDYNKLDLQKNLETLANPLEETKDEIQAIAKPIQKLPKDVWNTINTLGGEAIGALNQGITIGNSVSKQINTALKKQGMMGGMSDYDDTKEDPTLAGRRRGKRKGNEKNVRGGALRIPSSSVGIQIPS